MKIYRRIALPLVLCAAALGVSQPASAAAGIVQRAPDAYGAFVNTSAGRVLSSTAVNNYLTWDTNGQYVTVRTQLKDTGRNDGQVAGLYANLRYTDGTWSGWKTVAETANQSTFTSPISRRFVPSKRTAGVSLVACRYTATVGINACGAVSPNWDNPYT